MTDKPLYMRWAEDERRGFRRAEFTHEVSLQCAGREYILTARDVSETGIGTGPAAGLEAQAEGCLECPGFPVACRCRVVYSAEGEGVGIEFLDLSEESRMVLKNFVDEAN
ncbi:MAG: PilZ domain-containing protein [Terriglobia bacterium]